MVHAGQRARLSPQASARSPRRRVGLHQAEHSKSTARISRDVEIAGAALPQSPFGEVGTDTDADVDSEGGGGHFARYCARSPSFRPVVLEKRSYLEASPWHWSTGGVWSRER